MLLLPVVNGLIALTQALANLSQLLLTDWINLLVAVGLRKRKYPWGRVLDSVTNLPLPRALVTIHNQDRYGKVIDQTVTDKDGRFGFYVEPGHYSLWVKRLGYTFPSSILPRSYRGATFPIGKEKMAILDLLLDPAEVSKPWIAKLKRFGMELAVIHLPLLIIGTVMTGLSLVVHVSILGVILAIMYVFLWVIEWKNRHLGRHTLTLTDKKGDALPFHVLRLFNDKKQLVLTKATNSEGDVYILVPGGSYTLQTTSPTGTVHERRLDLPRGVLLKPLKVEA